MKWKRGQGLRPDRGPAGSGRRRARPRWAGRVVLGGALGRKSAGGAGGLIIVVIIGLLLISGVFGGGGGLSGLSGLGAGAGEPGGTLDPQGETDEFVSYLVSDIQDFWAETFSQSGRDYPMTKLVLFTGATSSACGPASSATGPFYCPADQKVYLDLGFFDELKSRFGAPGDFAMAYVIAHEFGHHVQTATGVSRRSRTRSPQDGTRSNELSVKQELQADCLAGVWAHSAISELEAGDIEEALTAAAAVGDDRIQRAHVRPHRPGVVDAWLVAAAPGLVHRRLSKRQRRRLRHVRRLAAGCESVGRDRRLAGRRQDEQVAGRDAEVHPAAGPDHELLGQRAGLDQRVRLRRRSPAAAAVRVERVEDANAGHRDRVVEPGSPIDVKPLITQACRPRHMTRPTGRLVSRMAVAATLQRRVEVGHARRARTARCRGR